MAASAKSLAGKHEDGNSGLGPSLVGGLQLVFLQTQHGASQKGWAVGTPFPGSMLRKASFWSRSGLHLPFE